MDKLLNTEEVNSKVLQVRIVTPINGELIIVVH